METGWGSLSLLHQQNIQKQTKLLLVFVDFEQWVKTQRTARELYITHKHISIEGKSERVCVRETSWRRGNTQFVVLRAEMLKSAKTFCIRRFLLPFTAAFTAHSLWNSWDGRRRELGSCNWFASPADTHTHTAESSSLGFMETPEGWRWWNVQPRCFSAQ